MLPENTGNVASMVSQAMAIYGHMNKKQLPPNDHDPPPEKEDEATLEDVETDEVISSLMKEAEDVVKSTTTQEGVVQDSSRTNLDETSRPIRETDHFTITNSPTRYQHHKDTTNKE